MHTELGCLPMYVCLAHFWVLSADDKCLSYAF